MNVVTLRSVRLMLKWVTVFGRVNQAHRPIQPEPTLCAGWDEYLAKAGGLNRHTA